MDKVQSSDKLNKVQTFVTEAVGASITVEVNFAAINNFPADEQKNVADFFVVDGYFTSFKGAFQSLTKVPSGKAWLSSTIQKIIVNPCPALPDQNTDTKFEGGIQGNIMTINVYLRSNRSLRSAYNSSNLTSAIQKMMPALKTGQYMDAITASQKIEKTTALLQELIGTPLQFDCNLFSIAAMNPDPDCKNASDFVAVDGMFTSFKGAFQDLCKVGSGKAWLGRFQVINVTFFSNTEQNTDTVFAVTASEPVLTISISLRTNRSLRSAYNSRGLEDAIKTAMPQLKVGADMDRITASKKLEKTQEELQKITGNTGLLVEFDLFTIANMNGGAPDDVKNAADFVSVDGYFTSFKGAFQNLCKVDSGKAWLARYPQIRVACVSNHDQKTDTVFTCFAQEPSLDVTISLRTNRSLRSAYNSRALEDAITEAIPQIKTGQEIDKITKSGKQEKMIEECRKITENPALNIEYDLFSVANMPYDHCKNVADFIAVDGMFTSFKGALGGICKYGSGKAWLQRFPSYKITFVANPDQNTDTVFNVAAAEPLLTFTISLRANRSLRSAYNSRALEEAIESALPQIKIGRCMDQITAADKINKAQQAVREACNHPNLVIEVDLNSIATLPSYDDVKNASDFFAVDGFMTSFKSGFQGAMKKPNFAQFITGQVQKIQVTCVSNHGQNTDTVFTAQPPAGGIMAIQVSLRTNRSLRSAYNTRNLEEAVLKAAGQ